MGGLGEEEEWQGRCELGCVGCEVVESCEGGEGGEPGEI